MSNLVEKYILCMVGRDQGLYNKAVVGQIVFVDRINNSDVHVQVSFEGSQTTDFSIILTPEKLVSLQTQLFDTEDEALVSAKLRGVELVPYHDDSSMWPRHITPFL